MILVSSPFLTGLHGDSRLHFERQPEGWSPKKSVTGGKRPRNEKEDEKVEMGGAILSRRPDSETRVVPTTVNRCQGSEGTVRKVSRLRSLHSRPDPVRRLTHPYVGGGVLSPDRRRPYERLLGNRRKVLISFRSVGSVLSPINGTHYPLTSRRCSSHRPGNRSVPVPGTYGSVRTR